MKLVDADLCSRAASSAHERDGEMEASGDSLPDTSRVVQHSIARPKFLLSAFLSRLMRGCREPRGAKQQWISR